jgi:hypothetical protein
MSCVAADGPPAIRLAKAICEAAQLLRDTWRISAAEREHGKPPSET